MKPLRRRFVIGAGCFAILLAASILYGRFHRIDQAKLREMVLKADTCRIIDERFNHKQQILETRTLDVSDRNAIAEIASSIEFTRKPRYFGRPAAVDYTELGLQRRGEWIVSILLIETENNYEDEIHISWGLGPKTTSVRCTRKLRHTVERILQENQTFAGVLETN